MSAIAHAKSNVLVFGDSLSAGYGIGIEQSWPALLMRRCDSLGLPYAIVNASISGETTAGGRSRLAGEMRRHRPAIVVVALGANDGLRGLPLHQIEDNLTAMVRAAKGDKARVLLVGMRLPPNYGADYTAGFADAFAKVARREGAEILPFLLEPIALDAGAFQADGLHPTAAAQPRLLDHVWTALRPMLK